MDSGSGVSAFSLVLTFYFIAAKRMGRRGVAEERILEGTQLRE